MSLVTVECPRPGDAYTLLQTGPILDVHLAPNLESGGVGACICGFDRHEKGGFSVGGGVTGPRVSHEVCEGCVQLADGPIEGLHKRLFASPSETKGEDA